LIVLGGTWSDYPEAYQIWFIRECFRALNDFGEGVDDREHSQQRILASVQSAHRANNVMTDVDSIAIHGEQITQTYNQVVSEHYLAPEQRQDKQAQSPTEQATWDELAIEHRRNEQAVCRCVGLTLETRPDNISEAEVGRMRRLGATRVQIGFQSLNDEVLTKNHRGHDVAATARAVALLRRAGFKIHAHWMPNLYGSTPAADQADFHKMFHELDFRPDELKIYPCTLLPSAELVSYYQRGEWQPYSPADLTAVLTYCLTHTPPWVRLTRVIRDIPTNEMYMPHLQPNLRQVVEKQVQLSDQTLTDIRSREIGDQVPQPPVQLETLTYQTSVSEERFLQFVDANHKLLGFLRLSLPTASPLFAELADQAIIRELHVYGPTQAIGEHTSSASQHQGLGTQLLTEARRQATTTGYQGLSVISAVGTRDYYRQRGFTDGKLYQHHKFSTDNVPA
jgi:elongator complex protein 3